MPQPVQRPQRLGGDLVQPVVAEAEVLQVFWIGRVEKYNEYVRVFDFGLSQLGYNYRSIFIPT